MKNPMQEAVDAVGGVAELASRLGVTYEAVRQMVAKGRCSYLRVIEIEKESGIPRSKLRPDLYPAH